MCVHEGAGRGMLTSTIRVAAANSVALRLCFAPNMFVLMSERARASKRRRLWCLSCSIKMRLYFFISLQPSVCFASASWKNARRRNYCYGAFACYRCIIAKSERLIFLLCALYTFFSRLKVYNEMESSGICSFVCFLTSLLHDAPFDTLYCFIFRQLPEWRRLAKGAIYWDDKQRKNWLWWKALFH